VIVRAAPIFSFFSIASLKTVDSGGAEFICNESNSGNSDFSSSCTATDPPNDGVGRSSDITGLQPEVVYRDGSEPSPNDAGGGNDSGGVQYPADPELVSDTNSGIDSDPELRFPEAALATSMRLCRTTAWAARAMLETEKIRRIQTIVLSRRIFSNLDNADYTML
jgi:hypothetical protein